MLILDLIDLSDYKKNIQTRFDFVLQKTSFFNKAALEWCVTLSIFAF